MFCYLALLLKCLTSYQRQVLHHDLFSLATPVIAFACFIVIYFNILAVLLDEEYKTSRIVLEFVIYSCFECRIMINCADKTRNINKS